jgi:hypothetical protein
MRYHFIILAEWMYTLAQSVCVSVCLCVCSFRACPWLITINSAARNRRAPAEVLTMHGSACNCNCNCNWPQRLLEVPHALRCRSPSAYALTPSLYLFVVSARLLHCACGGGGAAAVAMVAAAAGDICQLLAWRQRLADKHRTHSCVCAMCVLECIWWEGSTGTLCATGSADKTVKVSPPVELSSVLRQPCYGKEYTHMHSFVYLCVCGGTSIYMSIVRCRLTDDGFILFFPGGQQQACVCALCAALNCHPITEVQRM